MKTKKDKNKLSNAEIGILREMLQVILDDTDLRNGFRRTCGTTKREMERIERKLSGQIKDSFRNDFPNLREALYGGYPSKG